MPSGTPRSVRERARTEINFLSPTHPPFSIQCQAALQVQVHSTTVFRLQVSPPLWPGRAPCPVRGYHLGRRRCRDCTVDVGPIIGIFILHALYHFLSPLVLCSPSFRRCGVTSAVCCGSGWFSLLPPRRACWFFYVSVVSCMSMTYGSCQPEQRVEQFGNGSSPTVKLTGSCQVCVKQLSRGLPL